MSGNGDGPELPEGWEWRKVGEVATVIRGVSYKKDQCLSEPREGYLPLLRSGNVQARLDLKEKLVYVPEDLIRGDQHLKPGDIVVSVSNSRELVGKAAPVSSPWEGTFGAFLAVVRPIERAVDPSFLGWFFRSPGYRQAIASRSAATSNIANIRKGHVLDLGIALPPLEEQRRIVEKLELVLREIAAGEESIEWVRSGKSLYEEALIAAALRGELSPQSEDSGSATSYLEGHGISGTSDPSGVQCSFPSHWTVASLGDLSSAVTSGSRDWKPYYDRGTSVFVLAGNVRMRHLDLRERLHVDPPMDDPARKRSAVARDDLLLTIVGAGVGTIARVPTDLEEHFVCQSVALIRPIDADLSEYLELYLASPQGGQAYFETRYYGQGRPHLNFDDIKATPIPLPPPRERDAIVRTINARIAALDSLAGTLIESVAHAARLRRAAMHAVLGGKAV